MVSEEPGSRHCDHKEVEPSKGKVQRGKYLVPVGLGGYKWYQKSQVPSDVPARRLFPERVDMRRCVSKDARLRMGWIWWSPISIEERNEYQSGF